MHTSRLSGDVDPEMTSLPGNRTEMIIAVAAVDFSTWVYGTKHPAWRKSKGLLLVVCGNL